MRCATTTLILATSSAAAAEHSSKQIAKIGTFIIEAAGTRVETTAIACTTEAHATHWALTANLVVLGPLGLIADNVVGRGDFLELVFC